MFLPTFMIVLRRIFNSSLRTKDPLTGHRSLAHFYRRCQIWPVLDPNRILSPSPQPYENYTSKKLFMNGSNGGRVHLRVSLHRQCWVAGQRCAAQLHITNEGKKPVRAVRLALVRTETVYAYDPSLDYNTGKRRRVDEYDYDPDTCHTTSVDKVVAEEALFTGAHGNESGGYASAKGWWGGVPSGESLSFSHSILIPVSRFARFRVGILALTIIAPMLGGRINCRTRSCRRGDLLHSSLSEQ